MTACVLYRLGVDPAEAGTEITAIESAGLPLYFYRSDVPPGSLVVGRMSVLPFYRELEVDLSRNGSRLVNTFRQHQFIADMREWCAALCDMTPRLYENISDLPQTGPFVLKGQTNSKKDLWSTHMFARNKREAGEVWSRLADDGLVGEQRIYARDYVELDRLMTGHRGLPVSREFRVFVMKRRVLCGAFYWSSFTSQLSSVPQFSEVPRDFLDEAISRVGDSADFYALDVAKTAAGDWTVVELNDGQMSGLSCNDVDAFYRNLAESLI